MRRTSEILTIVGLLLVGCGDDVESAKADDSSSATGGTSRGETAGPATASGAETSGGTTTTGTSSDSDTSTSSSSTGDGVTAGSTGSGGSGGSSASDGSTGDGGSSGGSTGGTPGGSGPGGQTELYNPEAVVPSMCYTRTEGVFNPCYVCHQDNISGEGRENRQNDGYLQGDYNFSETALTNHWTNLFQDTAARQAEIDDAEIMAYVEGENYTALIDLLESMSWQGYIPDLQNLHLAAAAFDENGFALDGSGWVSFNYKPMPSTFWPTNGATDDVMIRLPPKFRQDAGGNDSFDVYMANLAILEAAIKNVTTITLPEVDENEIGVDLDGDMALGLITELDRPATYVGQASDTQVVTFLYPLHTEFLHTVRYVGVDDQGNIFVPPRMKELRYMYKTTLYDKITLGAFYDQEFQEKWEGQLPYYPDYADQGLYNKMGWVIRGYIEDAAGELRPATYEEGLFCMGCHNAVGSTIDKTFAFPRKVQGVSGWKYIDLVGMPDVPTRGETRGEYLTYLERVGGGSEFRNNDEMQERWFVGGTTTVDEAAVTAADVYELVAPSRERALQLNKAYRALVESQEYIYGRDTLISPPTNVFEIVDPNAAPLMPENRYDWDILLDWD